MKKERPVITKTLTVWSCRAICEDDSFRVVTGYYLDGDCVFLQRPWTSPIFRTVLARQSPFQYRLLDAIIGAADFRIARGMWIGELATTGGVLGAVTGDSKNALYTHLAALASEGLLEYVPAVGKYEPAMILIFPAAKNGLPLVMPNNSWQMDFIRSLEPTMKLFEVEAQRLNRVPVIDRFLPSAHARQEGPGLLGSRPIDDGDGTVAQD